jgi:hypothetical protein
MFFEKSLQNVKKNTINCKFAENHGKAGFEG